jgi:preprotein translocase subunit SecB
MSKQKKQKKILVLSPEEYKNLLSKIELIEVSLTSSNTSINLAKMVPESSSLGLPQISITDDIKRSKKKDQFQINANWHLTAKFEKDDKDFMDITASFNVLLLGKCTLPNSFWKIYNKSTLPLIVYPYFREFVQNMTARMNIPPLTLPILFK